MSKAPDWKKKYVDLEREVEVDYASNKETQKLLCRIIIRLTLATEGLDPVLDPYLGKLRDALKKGINKNVHSKMSVISEALVRARDEPAKNKIVSNGGGNVDLLQRLFEYSNLTGSKGQRLKQLGDQIASNPQAATDNDLDEYIRLLTGDSSSEKSNREGGSGLLGRIFSRGGQGGAVTEDDGGSIRLLLSLLGKLNWPGKLSKDILSLEGRLGLQDKDAVATVIQDLTKIVSDLLAGLNREPRATGSFLADLMARLHELDTYVASGQILQRESLQSRKDLGLAVKEEVGDIASSVRDAQDLQVLKHDVSSHLETIKGHMDKHLQEAEERFRESQQNEKKLRERLQEVEDETGVLRHKIMEAQARSAMDPVTGLSNRAAYDERMRDEYGRWQRFNNPLVLMVWDLDDFKQVNDRFGHQAGDKALRVIGQIMKKRLRQTDFVGRYGGEEFCVLLPNTPMEKAVAVAEQIRKSVEASGFHSGNKPIVLTISCGFTSFREEDTPETTFERADRALYRAKGEGKNRCISA